MLKTEIFYHTRMIELNNRLAKLESKIQELEKEIEKKNKEKADVESELRSFDSATMIISSPYNSLSF